MLGATAAAGFVRTDAQRKADLRRWTRILRNPRRVKTRFRNLIEVARANLSHLAAGGPLRAALTESDLRGFGRRVSTTRAEDLVVSTWPCVFGFVSNSTPEALRQLDHDVLLVEECTKDRGRRGQVRSFLGAGPGESNRWKSGLFEVSTKATALNAWGDLAEMEPRIPNGLRPDAVVRIGGRDVFFESTVLGESTEDAYYWKEHNKRFKKNPFFVGMRPGPLDMPGGKGPGMDADVIRIYEKVYEKVAPRLDPGRAQLSSEHPNVLLLSLWSGPMSLGSSSPGVGWAFDELFADQPRKRQDTALPSTNLETNLVGWLDHRARDLLNRGKITEAEYRARHRDLIAAPRNVSAVVFFKGLRMSGARMNYHADHPITHANLARFEAIFEKAPAYGEGS